MALLFLSRGDLPYEPLWRIFLGSATTALRRGAPSKGMLGGLLSDGGSGSADWRQLFNVYTHLPPGHAHPAGSLFAGHEVPGRVAVQWGSHSLVRLARLPCTWMILCPGPSFHLDNCTCPPMHLLTGHLRTHPPTFPPTSFHQVGAERALLRAALADPANQRFVLLSDSCVPLYPAPLIWAQLLSEERSRVNACRWEAWGLRAGGQACCGAAEAAAAFA